MNQTRPLKYLVCDDAGSSMGWRHAGGRYGCDRSRRILARFPDRADRIARATIEGGSRPHAEKAVHHG